MFKQTLLMFSRLWEIPTLPAMLMMTGAAAFWGTGFVINKASLENVPPLVLLAIELAASCTVLWSVAILRGEYTCLNRHTLRYGWTGLFEPGMAYLLFIAGLTTTSVSNAAILSATQPVMVIGLAWLLLRETIPPRLLFAMLIAMTGTLAVMLADTATFDAATMQGDMLILAGTLCASLYILVSRPAAARLPPALLAALQQTVGLGCVLIALFVETLFSHRTGPLNTPALTDYLVVIFSGITQYALAFLLYLRALRDLPVTKAALFLTLIPVFGMGGAALIGETVTLPQVAGAALVLLALVNVNLMDESDEGDEPEDPPEICLEV